MGLRCKIRLSVLPGVWIQRTFYTCICCVNNLMLCETFLDPWMSDCAWKWITVLIYDTAMELQLRLTRFARCASPKGKPKCSSNASHWNLFDFKFLTPMLSDTLDHQDFTRFPSQTHMTSLQILVNPFALIILLRLTALKGLTFCRKSQV